MDPKPRTWPYLSADVPGAGGRLKQVPEDFVVEEIPAYLPSGTGPFLFLWIEKRLISTPEVARALAGALELPLREVSYAGMKDKFSVSCQMFCVPAEAESKIGGLNASAIAVLSAARHDNRLRTGHLRGNRFSVRLREISDREAAKTTLALLRETGIPNYFGEQRFGQSQDTAALGRKLLLGQRLPRTPSRFLRKLYLSAYQSLLFNRALAARVLAKTIGRALAGDVLRKAATGGPFICDDPAPEQPRVDSFEVSPAGPIFGPKMLLAKGRVAEAEAELLREEGVSLKDFEGGRGETLGARRAYRVPFHPSRSEWDGRDLLLDFELPKGSYATVPLGEIAKSNLE